MSSSNSFIYVIPTIIILEIMKLEEWLIKVARSNQRSV